MFTTAEVTITNQDQEIRELWERLEYMEKIVALHVAKIKRLEELRPGNRPQHRQQTLVDGAWITTTTTR